MTGPSVRYWHLWRDANGISHLQSCMMTRFTLQTMRAPAAPQWQGEKTSGAMTTMVTVQPIGWVGEWHENPKPQWILPLSGRWFVKRWTGRESKWTPENCRSAAIRTAGNWRASAAIAPVRSAPRPPC
jgi:hypothetical protein